MKVNTVISMIQAEQDLIRSGYTVNEYQGLYSRYFSVSKNSVLFDAIDIGIGGYVDAEQVNALIEGKKEPFSIRRGDLSVEESVAIVLELAQANMLSENDPDNVGLEEERKRQAEAYRVVSSILAMWLASQ